jgi:Tfp pilus assembly protein PilV
MGEYTDQEIEMLARFCDASWPHESDRWTDIVREALSARQPDPVDRIICVAARLMRAAREQGAAEMRERAALAIRRAYYAGNVNARTEDDIRNMPLAPTDNDAKASKLARLQRQLSDAGDRHDRDECDRLDAEIAAVERTDE